MKCSVCGKNIFEKYITDEQGAIFCSRLCKQLQNGEDSKINRQSTNGGDNIAIVNGVVKNAGIYADNVVLGAVRGHGFAAEKANDLFDKAMGKDAEIVGGDNVLNGADRLVDGVYIQTKYCNSGSKCIEECFDGNGRFRYMRNGAPMEIEVPSDKYDAAVQAMEDRIRKGKIPGVTDPTQAKVIVREGSFTYEQARNIARFGTVESITYDAANGAVVAGSAFALSAVISFACATWKGERSDEAIRQACYSGLKVGGVTWVSGIVANQLVRTGVETSLRSSTDFFVQSLGPKAASLIVAGNSGRALYGAAAMNNVSKLLRGNVVTGAVVTVVLSVNDVRHLVNGKISGAQAFKNITTTATGVIGGAGGMMAGATTGAMVGSVVPIVGTAIGGMVGGLIGTFLGSSAASSVTRSVLDEFIEDDAKSMLEIFNETFSRLAFDYLLFDPDIEVVLEQVAEMDMAEELRNMFASSDPAEYACSLLEPIVIEVALQRPAISLPSDEEMLSATRLVFEELADPNISRAMTTQKNFVRGATSQMRSMHSREREYGQKKQELIQERGALQEELADILRESRQK